MRVLIIGALLLFTEQAAWAEHFATFKGALQEVEADGTTCQSILVEDEQDASLYLMGHSGLQAVLHFPGQLGLGRRSYYGYYDHASLSVSHSFRSGGYDVFVDMAGPAEREAVFLTVEVIVKDADADKVVCSGTATFAGFSIR